MAIKRPPKRLSPHRQALKMLKRINRQHVKVAVAGTLAVSTLALQPLQNALDVVRSSGELHLVGVTSPSTFFQQDGHTHGLQFELAQQFANELGVKLVVDPVASPHRVLQAIRRNQAQLALTGITAEDPRLERLRVSNPVLEVQQQLVQRSGQRRPKDIQDLAGKVVGVVAGSTEAQHLKDSVREVDNVKIIEIRQGKSLDLLGLLDEGRVDFVAMNSREFDAFRPLFPTLRDSLSLERTDAVSWVFMKSADHSLYQAAQDFLARKQADGTLQRLAEFYSNGNVFDSYGAKHFSRDIANRLPRYQSLFERESNTTDVDWRLLAAIAYQESKWNPNAVSPTGVRGLMMLTQGTASMMGVKNREHAGQSIRGGSAYFKYIHDRMPDSIAEPDRTWMALASYNMGPAHILRARKLTERNGGDANSWLDVSRNLRQLAADNRRQGRAVPDVGQGLHYVQQVRRYYDAIALNTQVRLDKTQVATLDFDISNSTAQ
ncbi:membrane-bound lytic murein transglycosylase F [Paraperlucidibaca baekdonensis]|uniref:Membrane-bound lytic murein transglycosylase F n=1 Tax=Paraperlucidibaca baekdonensis TaxID=748120 RepID=A0A3E0H2U0_9GAMM|nr:membrane-bound lytic murein transglycosylase MltF [Paraperlucidibaca baekdonensis]REH37628.1 membrane-bound lytic murein transglycosylase F [Paraperlucidibaca baekdonensis]